MKKDLLIPIAVAAMDQAIKSVVRRMTPGAVFFSLPGLFQLTHSVNSGAALSLLSGQTALLAALSVLLLALTVRYVLWGMDLTRPSRLACLVLIGGGLGNLTDRLLFGGVTDYIQITLFDFPIFNLADIAITLSAAVLMILLLTNRFENNSGERHG